MHQQRSEDVAPRKLVKRHAARSMNNLTKCDVTNIAVNEASAGLIAQWLRNQSLDGLVIASPTFLQIKVRSIPGTVCQEQFDSDSLASFALDFGNVIRQRI